MTHEEKLLFQTLSAMMPYRVICTDNRHGDSVVNVIDINPSSKAISVYYWDFDEYGDIKYCKPYLRSIDSMTKEEKEELKQLSDEYLEEWTNAKTSIDKWKLDAKISYKRSVFYNSHYLDWNGLIPMGLALEAPKGMYEVPSMDINELIVDLNYAKEKN